MTLFINQRGVVYQKDLGKTTEKAVREITGFNPDNTWKAVEDQQRRKRRQAPAL